MSFRRSLLQLAGRKVSGPTMFGEPKIICPIFQSLRENDVCEFESSQPSHGVRFLVLFGPRIDPRNRAGTESRRCRMSDMNGSLQVELLGHLLGSRWPTLTPLAVGARKSVPARRECLLPHQGNDFDRVNRI